MALTLRKYRKYDLGGNTSIKYNPNDYLGNDTTPEFKEKQVGNIQGESTVGGGNAASKISGQAGIWGAISQVGEQTGAGIRGNQSNAGTNYAGNWVTPTHTNVIDAVQHGNTSEVLDNVFFGGLFGTKARRQADDYRKATKARNEATTNYFTNVGNQKINSNDLQGNASTDNIYEEGGELGKPKPKKSITLNKYRGLESTNRDYTKDPIRAEEWHSMSQELKQKNLDKQNTLYDQYKAKKVKSLAIGGSLNKLNSDTVEVEGRTHAEGGVKIPEAGAEVENKETISGNYVFSDLLGFADRHKPIAKQIGKIEKKPASREGINSLTHLRRKEANLKAEQEHLKADLDLPSDPAETEMALGGKLKKYAYGSSIAGEDAIFGEPNTLNTKKRGTGMKVANAVAPYLSNLANSLRVLPKPNAPLLEGTSSPTLVNYGADKVALDQSLRGLNVGVDAATPNTNLARATKVANLSKFLSAKGELTQQENNTNAGITNQFKQFNAGVNARNLERTNNYNQELVSRNIAQQNLNSENVADATTKFQQQQRNNSLIDLERRKLDILPGLYKDTGVLNRNYGTNLNAEQESFATGGGIHINPANKGKFNALKARTGKSTEELTHSSNLLTKKRAIFAQNAAKWHHKGLGGMLIDGKVKPVKSLLKYLV